MPAFLIPLLLKFLVSALSSAVQTHSTASDTHQKLANAHQTAAEQSSKLLSALLNVVS